MAELTGCIGGSEHNCSPSAVISLVDKFNGPLWRSQGRDLPAYVDSSGIVEINGGTRLNDDFLILSNGNRRSETYAAAETVG